MINLKNKKERKQLMRRIVPLVMATVMVLSVIMSAVTGAMSVRAISPEAVEKQELEKLELVTDSIYIRQGDTTEQTITVRNNGYKDLKITEFESVVNSSGGNWVLTFSSDSHIYREGLPTKYQNVLYI